MRTEKLPFFLPVVTGTSPWKRPAARFPSGAFLAPALAVFAVGCLLAFGSPKATAQASPNATVFVHSKFGGQIFGFDIDQNGGEGILTEARNIGGGRVLAAVETFDQHSGKIIKVIAKTQSKDDFLTLGVFGNGVGLVEREKVKDLFVDKRVYHTINPLDANQFTGPWTPPIDKGHILEVVSRNQGNGKAAFWAYDNSGNFMPFVFASNVAKNTFGPMIAVTTPDLQSVFPALAYNSKTNKAIAGAQRLGNPFVAPVIAEINLKTGTTHLVPGRGTGSVNGMAVDPETNTLCTTTEIDFSVQFYDLNDGSGFSEVLPGATNQIQSGADVEFDPVNKLFLVAQSVSSTSPSGSSVHVYDVKGNYLSSVNGLNFSNTFNVIGAHIGLKPSERVAFIDGPDEGVTEIQSFSY